MSTVGTRPYEPAKREALFDLLDRVWGERPRADEFSWWFEQGPSGPALIALAEDGDRVVGVASAGFFRARVEGGEQLVSMAVQFATDPAYRGRGIFGELVRSNETTAAGRGCTVALTYPNNASRPILLGKLGWRELWRGRVWVRPPLPTLRRGSLRVEELTSIPPEAAELAPTAANGLIADATFLDWRYVRSPRHYRVLGAYDGERLRGLVAFCPRRGRLAVIGHAFGRTSQLLRAVAGARPTIALVPAPQRREFLRAGFLPTVKSVRVLGKPLRPDIDAGGDWRFQLGDLDVF